MTINEAMEKMFSVINAVRQAKSEDSPGGEKITIPETIGLAIKGIGLIPVITSFDQLKEDWISRDDEKKQQWIDTFAENFDLKNDEVEEQIERLVKALLDLEDVIVNLSQPDKSDPDD